MSVLFHMLAILILHHEKSTTKSSSSSSSIKSSSSKTPPRSLSITSNDFEEEGNERSRWVYFIEEGLEIVAYVLKDMCLSQNNKDNNNGPQENSFGNTTNDDECETKKRRTNSTSSINSILSSTNSISPSSQNSDLIQLPKGHTFRFSPSSPIQNSSGSGSSNGINNNHGSEILSSNTSFSSSSSSSGQNDENSPPSIIVGNLKKSSDHSSSSSSSNDGKNNNKNLEPLSAFQFQNPSSSSNNQQQQSKNSSSAPMIIRRHQIDNEEEESEEEEEEGFEVLGSNQTSNNKINTTNQRQMRQEDRTKKQQQKSTTTSIQSDYSNLISTSFNLISDHFTSTISSLIPTTSSQQPDMIQKRSKNDSRKMRNEEMGFDVDLGWIPSSSSLLPQTTSQSSCSFDHPVSLGNENQSSGFFYFLYLYIFLCIGNGDFLLNLPVGVEVFPLFVTPLQVMLHEEDVERTKKQQQQHKNEDQPQLTIERGIIELFEMFKELFPKVIHHPINFPLSVSSHSIEFEKEFEILSIEELNEKWVEAIIQFVQLVKNQVDIISQIHISNLHHQNIKSSSKKK